MEMDRNIQSSEKEEEKMETSALDGNGQKYQSSEKEKMEMSALDGNRQKQTLLILRLAAEKDNWLPTHRVTVIQFPGIREMKDSWGMGGGGCIPGEQRDEKREGDLTMVEANQKKELEHH